MKVLVSADHRGADAALKLGEKLEREGLGVEYVDICAGRTCDYPERAHAVATRIARGEADRGVLICGTGIGMSLAANKVKGARAAVVHDELTAELSRSHNDANILCLSADLLGQRLMEKIADVWFGTEFAGGRHARRVRKIHAIEQGLDPSNIPEEVESAAPGARSAPPGAPSASEPQREAPPAPHLRVSFETRARMPSDRPGDASS